MIHISVEAVNLHSPYKIKQEITPALCRRINKARKEYAAGETITCRTQKEMQQFFDSL